MRCLHSLGRPVKERKGLGASGAWPQAEPGRRSSRLNENSLKMTAPTRSTGGSPNDPMSLEAAASLDHCIAY